MPFSVVLTEENSQKLISLVPSNWVKNSILLWPNTRKTAEIDKFRREEKEPSKEWKKMKCKVKAYGLETFSEGIKVENLYASFEDTEDEERYTKNRLMKRTHPAFKAITDDLLDLNSDFEIIDTSINITANAESEAPITLITKKGLAMNPDYQNASKNITANAESEAPIKGITEKGRVMNPETENAGKNIIANGETEAPIITENCLAMNAEPAEHQNDEPLITMGLVQLNNLIAENSSLTKENEMLKKTTQQFQTLEQQTQRGFAMIQVQLDKLFELMQNKMCNSETVISNLNNEEEIIAQKNIQFPLKSKEELDILENQLDVDFEKALVKHFSKICGISGKLKIGKVGLQLVRHMFTDDLLNLLTWKGIKGCTKVPFSPYIKIRHLFFQIAHLADKSCSEKDTDALLQNSAIKHSGQRIKRQSCEMKKTIPKKKRTEGKENETIDTADKSNCSIDESRKVNVLSDVKITNKIIDSKHEIKILNISSDNLLNSPIFKQNNV